MGVVLGELERGLSVFEGLRVESAVEDGLHGSVRGAPDAKRPSTCGLESFRAVAFAEAEDAEAGSVAVLGVGSAVHDVLDECRSAGPGLLGPTDEARGAPLEMGLVGLGPVAGISAEPALTEAAYMGGDAATVVEDLDAAGGDTNLDRPADELVGDAVEMPQGLDVVVDIGPRRTTLGDLERSRRQSLQCRSLEGLELRAPASLELLKRAVVQNVQETADLDVELGQTEERVVAQRRQDPSLG